MVVRNTTPVPPLPRHINILSFDSGLGAGLVEKINKYYPKFVRDLDLIIITAQGRVSSLEFLSIDNAVVLGDLEKNVLVIDFDLDCPKVFHNLNVSGSSKEKKISDLFVDDDCIGITNPSSAGLVHILLSSDFKFKQSEISLLSVGNSKKQLAHLTCKTLLDASYKRINSEVQDLEDVVEWLEEFWL